MSSSCAHCIPSCTLGWESHLPVCCHEVPVYLLGIMRGSACALLRGFAGPGKVRGSALSGLELRQLLEKKSCGSSIWAPLPLCHHHRDFQCLEENIPEHLYQTHISEGSPGEKPPPIWVNASSCILQTTTVRMCLTCVCHLKQMPSKTSEKPLPQLVDLGVLLFQQYNNHSLSALFLGFLAFRKVNSLIPKGAEYIFLLYLKN